MRHWIDADRLNLTMDEAKAKHELALQPGSCLRIAKNDRFHYFARTMTGWRTITQEQYMGDGYLYMVTVMNADLDATYQRKTRAIDVDAAREYATCMYRCVTNDQRPVTTSTRRIDSTQSLSLS